MEFNDYVKIPREIKRDWVDGKLTHNEFDILIWIFLNASPYDGRFEVSYQELVEFSKGKIGYDNIRQIISSLRHHNWIYFSNHRGRGGKFTIYPLNFSLTNKHIQILDDFKITTSKHSQSQQTTQMDTQPHHNLDPQHHNLKQQTSELTKLFSMDKNNTPITTPYNKNNNKNENNNNLINKNLKNSSNKELNVKGRSMLRETINKINQ